MENVGLRREKYQENSYLRSSHREKCGLSPILEENVSFGKKCEEAHEN